MMRDEQMREGPRCTPQRIRNEIMEEDVLKLVDEPLE
jgi:hypothetical protein